MNAFNRCTSLLAPSLLALAVAGCAGGENGIQITSDDIGGVVKSANGPEAGVWVIAETRELKSRYTKIVVTDDQGRFVIPDLPKAKYEVWVRGYGLVDSKHITASPGSRQDLTAVVAPDEKAAAQYYPAAYWLSMLHPPATSEFPGTGDKGNGISTFMTTQQPWMLQINEQCMSCHQLGDKATRELATGGNSVHAWGERIKMMRPAGDNAIADAGKSLGTEMQMNMNFFGRERALKMYADWTDRIAAGEVPKEAPKRPSGVERNVVVTVIDWGLGHYVHDQISSDHRDPTVNGSGKVYGAPMYHGLQEELDPVTLETRSIPIPGLDGSPHDKEAGAHANEMDSKGRVFNATSTSKSTPAAAFCTDGSSPYSKYYPLTHRKMSGQIPVFDQATNKMTNIPICVGGNHNAFDRNDRLYMSGDSQVVSWIDMRVWDKTHDSKLATGWCPMVLDTSGDGKIDPDRNNWAQDEGYEQIEAFNMGSGMKARAALYDEGNAHSRAMAVSREAKPYNVPVVVPPGKDLQFKRFLYGLGTSQIDDGSVWLAAYDAGIPKMRSGIVRLELGNNPPLTCKAEFYEAPVKDGKFAAYGVRAAGVDSEGIAWAQFSSGHIGRFDRRKCKVLNGPTATGQQCPEGWTITRLPTPLIGDSDASADMPYNIWTDFKDVVGLGKGALFFPTVNSDSIVALPPGQSKFVTFRVPYPMGFYTRGLDFRIASGKSGWASKEMNATYSSKAQWHQENGDESSKWVSFQVRPNPLAN